MKFRELCYLYNKLFAPGALFYSASTSNLIQDPIIHKSALEANNLKDLKVFSKNEAIEKSWKEEEIIEIDLFFKVSLFLFCEKVEEIKVNGKLSYIAQMEGVGLGCEFIEFIENLNNIYSIISKHSESQREIYLNELHLFLNKNLEESNLNIRLFQYLHEILDNLSCIINTDVDKLKEDFSLASDKIEQNIEQIDFSDSEINEEQENNAHEIQFSKTEGLLEYLVCKTDGIKTSNVYKSSLAIPMVPICLPYEAVTLEDLSDIEQLDSRLLQVPLAVKLEENIKNNLPSYVKALMEKINFNLNNNIDKVEIFIVMQNKVENWQKDSKDILFRPHPWLHQDAPETGDYSKENICIVSLAKLNSKFGTPAIIENVNTFDDGGHVEFQKYGMKINGVESYDVTDVFYSVCIDKNITTGKINKIAITLHNLLNSIDLAYLHEAIYSLSKKDSTEFYLNKLLSILENDFSRSTISIQEIKFLINGNRSKLNNLINSSYYISEQKPNDYIDSIYTNQQQTDLLYNESSMQSLNRSQQHIVNIVKERYREKFEELGGTAAILHQLKSFLAGKFIEQRNIEGKSENWLLNFDYDWVNRLNNYQKRYYIDSVWHCAYRLLLDRNTFLHPNAQYQEMENIVLNNGETIERPVRTALTEEHKEKIAYFWLAASDPDIVPTDINTKNDGLKESFAAGLKDMLRANNYENILNRDDLDLDKPTCTYGVSSRLSLILVAHPIMDEKENLDIMQGVRFRFQEFFVDKIKKYLQTCYSLDIENIVNSSLQCWIGSSISSQESKLTWNNFFDEQDIINNIEYRQEVEKFIKGFQYYIHHAIDKFNKESKELYGKKYEIDYPKEHEIKSCSEFGGLINYSSYIYKSYEKFFNFQTKFFWKIKKESLEAGIDIWPLIANFSEQIKFFAKKRSDELKNINKVDEANEIGFTVLHKACEEKNVKKIEDLLKSGCDVNAKDYICRRPLTLAISNNLRLNNIIRNIFQNAIEQRQNEVTDLITEQNDRSYTRFENFVDRFLQQETNQTIPTPTPTPTPTPIPIPTPTNIIDRRQESVRERVDRSIREIFDAPIAASLIGDNNNSRFVFDNNVTRRNTTTEYIRGTSRLNRPNIITIPNLENITVRAAINFFSENYGTINQKNHNGKTPLHLAIEFNNIDLVELLLMLKANVNIKDNIGNTPLHIAAEKGSIYVSRLLYLSGADCNLKNNYEVTAIQMAVNNSHTDLSRELRNRLSYRAENRTVNTAQAAAEALIQFNNLLINTPLDRLALSRLISNSPNFISISDELGVTPLARSVSEGNEIFTLELLIAGADPNVLDSDDHFALQCAIEKRNIKLCRMLVIGGSVIPSIFAPNADLTICAELSRVRELQNRLGANIHNDRFRNEVSL